MKQFCLIGFILWNLAVYSQITQTIRGKVIEKETHLPLVGASVFIADTALKKGAISDEDGNFRITEVPVGKHTLKITYVGYKEKTLDIQVGSAKEVILSIELEESYTETQEVVIEGIQRGEVQNELAMVSTKSFDVSETERYAGSRGDPARMASNFAGVQGADDSRNDIVVRGNSPLGVVYRVEGFDIPNPNHFAVSGSTGGPVCILNNKIMGNSDFYTSAFPAEYGNATSAVFDIKLRNGNNEKREFSAQLGFLGTEIAAEGPLKKSKASYIMVYRYSTLQLFKFLGISIGTDAVPKYQDLTFKFFFPLKNYASFSIFGMGGNSAIDIKISEQKKPSTDFYGDDDRDQYFRTHMGVVGLNYQKSMANKILMKIGLAFSQEKQSAIHDYIIRHLDNNQEWVIDSIYNLLRFAFYVNKISYFTNFNVKFNKKHVLKYGIFFHQLFFNFQDSALTFDHSRYQKRWDYLGSGFLFQAFLQWKYQLTEKWSFTIGLHNQYFSVSNSVSWIEPRVGTKYQINQRTSVFAGAGLHSQVQPYYVYFYQKNVNGNWVRENEKMGLTKSFHSVLGYERAFSATLRFKTEIYFQHLFEIPVEVKPSAFSLTNMGSGFSRFFPDKLQNTGTANNYGIEFTLERFFNKSFFFLLTASLFDAKYKASDGIVRNTDYNGKYATNLLAGKEFKIKQKTILGLSTKVTTVGGRWYGIADTAASNFQKELVFLDSAYNSLQFRPYFRTDLRINFKINSKKITHEIALDLVNIFNTKNILGLTYSPNPLNPNSNPIRENYQLGFLPLFYYRIDF